MNKNIQPFALLLSALLALAPTWAGPEHNHGESTAAVTGNAPKRLPDDSVFLPKNSQRQLAVRTVVAEERLAPQSVELTGRVLMVSNSGGRVQPTQTGRVEVGPRGLLRLGQRVQKGEALAVVRSSASAIEPGNQQSQSAELRAQLELARRRVDRLSQLRDRPGMDAQIAAAAQAMEEAIPDCLVSGYEHLIERLKLPDPDDRTCWRLRSPGMRTRSSHGTRRTFPGRSWTHSASRCRPPTNSSLTC